jgi:hypothetical protein
MTQTRVLRLGGLGLFACSALVAMSASTGTAVAQCKGVRIPPPKACAATVCVSGDHTYEYVPFPLGTACNKIGLCDEQSVDCIMPALGQVFPSFVVVAVMYPPPGLSSFVEYNTGTTVGTTLETTNSWNNSLTFKLIMDHWHS